MSRLIVKNLPAYFTQEQLRSHFEATDGPGGTLTDVKLVSRQDGISRRFGFIGYKTPVEAERAQKWFNKSFAHSSRIIVDVVDGAKDAPASRPNKRPRLGPSPSEAETSAAGAKAGQKPKDDKKSREKTAVKSNDAAHFEEFVNVMQPRSKRGPSWANDDTVIPPPAAIAKDVASDAKSSKKIERNKQASDEDDAGFSATAPADAVETISDMDWLRRHTTQPVGDDELGALDRAFEQSDESLGEAGKDAVSDNENEDAPKPLADPVKDTILQTSRLFLRNLAFSCTEDELRDLFKSFDGLSQIHIPLDHATKQPKGLAYVTFEKPETALAVYEALDKTSFQGRLLHILPAVDQKSKAEGNIEGKPKTLREQRATQRKSGAGKEFNWAMLYMNSDAVASSIADRMNIPKSEILNSESDNAAVKLALAETHIINETKSFLESHGVVLSVLSDSARLKRSDTTILVKNIPYGTSADTLRSLFGSHGELQRVLVPPAGTLAVIEFAHATDARTAFRSLAYRRLGNSVIYLEKAPVGMFSENAPTEPVVASGFEPIKALSKAAATADEAPTGDEEPSLSSGTTLFLKNLAFSTTSAGLVQALRHLPGFAFARVQAKVDPARPQARLSMGYGFAGFKTKEEAKRAMKSLEGFVLDGHALAVKWAGRGADEVEGGEKKVKARSAKMIVKNVPFEVTKKDIRELFGAHAQLKSVRLPRKFDHRTRGFAFLEFVSPHEAERAYSMLRHTHLLGRHLVLEWAEDGAMDVDELRKKAGVGFGGGKELPGKKRKLEFTGEDTQVAEDDN